MVKNVEPQAFESKMDHQIDSIIHLGRTGR